MDRLLDILKAEGRRISEEFKLSSGQGEGTPQEVADFREHAVQAFVARFLPQSHIVSKGKITDLDGNQSDSVDCVILNPAHPHLVDSQGKFRLIFADGCDAAVEIKPNLGRKDELHRAAGQCRSVKRILRSRSPLLLHKTMPAALVAHSQFVPYYVFSMKAFQPKVLYAELASHYAELAIPLEEQIDAVFISDVGVVKNVKHAELYTYSTPSPSGKSVGWYFEQWGEATPLGLLLSLEYSIPAFPGVAESIMRRALSKAKFAVQRLGDGV